MVNISQSEAGSNFSSWLEWAGLNNLPEWLKAESADSFIFTALIIAAILFLSWPFIRSFLMSKEEKPTKTIGIKIKEGITGSILNKVDMIGFGTAIKANKSGGGHQFKKMKFKNVGTAIDISETEKPSTFEDIEVENEKDRD